MWRISVNTTLEAEEAVTELVGELFGVPASAYTDFESGVTTVAVYCRRRLGKFPAQCALLRDGLAQMKRFGLKMGSGRIRLQKIRYENWAESWKRHFKPLEIDGALLVKPSWSRRRPRKGQSAVVLDPGLSFGTGHHPTTAFCLRELADRCPHGQPQAFLDLGTGSGILAIAAAKLGYAPVRAIDLDPAAVRVARANARRNGVSRKIQIVCQDVAKLPLRPPQHYDLICANLLSTLLVSQRKRIVRQLKPGGSLILAGILKSEFNLVARNYSAMGLQLVVEKGEKEWRSGTFQG